MKFFYLLAICVLSLAAIVTAEPGKIPPPNKFDINPSLKKVLRSKLPTVTGDGGGSRKNGFDVNLDASQKVWESQNKRHSVDVTGSHSQLLGNPYGSGRPDHRVGGIYKHRF